MTILNGGGSSGVSPNKFDQGIEDVKDAVQDVQTSVNRLSSTMQSGMTQLSTDVNDAVDEMQTTINNAPVGMAPPPIGVFSAESVDEGISCTYNMNDTQNNNDTHYQRAKGIMVRYSTEGYPQSEKDGVLGFIDEDIHDAETLKSKSKTSIITGLTNGNKYYLSAFTYSFYNVFQHNIEFGNYGSPGGRLTCSYTGNKGALTVDVTQDYDYKTLGEFTATLTPSSGSAKTQTRTGPGQVVFAGLDAGTYTLSFSTETYFTTPESQQIVITAGQPNTTSAEYIVSKNISDYSWAEIKSLADSGKASEVFELGQTKQIMVGDVSMEFEIVAFNHNRTNTTTGETRAITFMSKSTYPTTSPWNADAEGPSSFPTYETSDLRTLVDGTIWANFPEDVKSVVGEAARPERASNYSGQLSAPNAQRKLWVPSATELFGTANVINETGIYSDENNKWSSYEASTGYYSQFPHMISDDKRKKDKQYWTSSQSMYEMRYSNSRATIVNVATDGHYLGATCRFAQGVCVCFCV